MLRKIMVVIAIVLLGSSGLSTGAFARSGGHGGGGGGDSVRANHLRGGFGGIRADSFGVYDNSTGGSHNGLLGHGNRDVWGHWGAYYGPMIPAI
ncbi:MAG: hypothetical protein QOF09_4675 [Alphaproteobacteria bacterium]|jgi:hypothetical protein|nr:hypothetical protein [Alphaproteobacteria bacterium]